MANHTAISHRMGRSTKGEKREPRECSEVALGGRGEELLLDCTPETKIVCGLRNLWGVGGGRGEGIRG